MDKNDIMRRAAEAFSEYDELRQRQRLLDAKISGLCREFGLAEKMWGVQPYMLRKAVNSNFILKRA